jgi:hypothetical protein
MIQNNKDSDQDEKRNDIPVFRRQMRGNQNLDDSQKQSTRHHAANASKPADDDHNEGFEDHHQAHIRIQKPDRTKQKTRDRGKQGRQDEGQRDHPVHVDAHEPGRLLILGRGLQLPADRGSTEQKRQPGEKSEGDCNDQDVVLCNDRASHREDPVSQEGFQLHGIRTEKGQGAVS